MKGLFITATDTNVGKTMITGAIAAACKERGINIGVFKPLASGGIVNEAGELVSEDANFLMKAAKIGEEKRREVNEVCLGPAMTPAVAAKITGKTIDMEKLALHIEERSKQYDLVLVEGVGGLAAPLWQDYCVTDFIERLGLPALLVADAGLGSINHTVLSAFYAKEHNVRLRGIILNRWDDREEEVLNETNAAYIEQFTQLPIWGKMPITNTISVEKNCTEKLAQIAQANLAIEKIIDCMKIEGGIR